MALRYVITMALYSERGWFGVIPIVFQSVLTAYLYVWIRYEGSAK